MKAFSASTTIQASPRTIWQILTDASSYPEWDPNMISITGTIAPGESLAILTTLDPNRTFNVKVTTFEPEKKMVWSSGMPLGLFNGERTFTLEPVGEGQTRVTTREEFKGLLLPLFSKSLDKTEPTFEQFVQGLKQRAEQG
jgi:hypothetical protein